MAPNLLGTVLGRDGVLTLPTLGHAWLESRLAVDRTSLVLDDMVAELPDGAARGSLIVGFAPKPTVTADVPALGIVKLPLVSVNATVAPMRSSVAGPSMVTAGAGGGRWEADIRGEALPIPYSPVDGQGLCHVARPIHPVPSAKQT